MTPRMKSLLAMLRKLEEAGARPSIEELEEMAKAEAAYKGIRTYLSKYLKSLVHKHADGRYEVHGALAMSEAEFARLLSQNKGAEASVVKYDDRDEWANALLALSALGPARGFELTEDEKVELLDILE